MVLGARAGDAGVDIARATGGGETGGPPGVGTEEMVLGAETGAEWSGVPSVGVTGSWGKSERVSDCSVVDEAVGVWLGVGLGGDRAGGGVRSGGET